MRLAAGSRASAACAATAIIIRHLNNFCFHAEPLSFATRRLPRFATPFWHATPAMPQRREIHPETASSVPFFSGAHNQRTSSAFDCDK